ncbi:MAG: NUDIX hydrolase [Candidatus Omnitrophica bacterium]|nr:NUDIX hydrolase [Candidatus Omnitrophota bacterium]
MKLLSRKVLYKGNWLTLKELTLATATNQTIKWEVIERRNSKNLVVVLARLKHAKKIILIKQFRPAMNKIVLGLPAGIVYARDIRKTALKELKEETGYTGTVKKLSPALAFNPSLCDEKITLAYVDINDKSFKNNLPKQNLENEEQIEVVLVDETNISAYIFKEQKKGTVISAAIWYLFISNPWRKSLKKNLRSLKR